MSQSTTPTSLNFMQLFERIIDLTAEKNFDEDSIAQAQPYLQVVAERLSLTEAEALLLSACVNLCCDNSIEIADLAKQFGCKNIRIQSYWAELLSLDKKRLLVRKQDYIGSVSFSMPPTVLIALRENSIPTPISYEGLSIPDWFDKLAQLLDNKEQNRLSYDGFTDELGRLIVSNPSLPVTQRLRYYQLEDVDETTVLFLGILSRFVLNRDDHIIRHDLANYFESREDLRHEILILENGEHYLQDIGLVEFACADGQVESNAWKLTDKAKREFLEGIKYRPTQNTNLLQAEKIQPKSLFFAPRVEKQVCQLADLLRPERFSAVQKRLEEYGMRRGFACIFYGTPGTGKTETVYQLARRTGRAIQMVDVPNLRSKWVGDTEKNIKRVFDDYRQLCMESAVAPILLFNEADAVLCRRNEGTTNSVDKMENAMQNIILQELETLDGILIATTNLTGNLDAAFERRFLYKIEFPKPTAAESCRIWHSLLPELTEDEALALAHDYAFSGGQIENIARKHIVDTILTDTAYCNTETDSNTNNSNTEQSHEHARQHLLSSIREACTEEKFHTHSKRTIGFS